MHHDTIINIIYITWPHAQGKINCTCQLIIQSIVFIANCKQHFSLYTTCQHVLDANTNWARMSRTNTHSLNRTISIASGSGAWLFSSTFVQCEATLSRVVHASFLSSTWLGENTAHSFSYKLGYFWNAAAVETQQFHWSAYYRSAAGTCVDCSDWERCGSAMPWAKQLHSTSACATTFCCGWIWPQGGTFFTKVHVGLRWTGKKSIGARAFFFFFSDVGFGKEWKDSHIELTRLIEWVTDRAWRGRV